MGEALPTRDGELNFHHTARRSLGVILDCAAAHAHTRDARYLRRAVAELEAVCAFRDWNHGESFLDTAEMSVGVSLGYDWLHEHLSAAERSLICGALTRHVLAHAPAVYVDAVREEGAAKASQTHTTGWVNAAHNWNQVCNAGMIAAALAVGADGGGGLSLARVALEGALTSLPRAMRAYEPDGAWPEGPQYYSFGTSYNVLALAMLESALDGVRDAGGLVAAHGAALRASAAWRAHIEGPLGHALNHGDNGQSEVNADAHLSWLAAASADAGARQRARDAVARKVRSAGDAAPRAAPRKRPGWAKFDRLFALHLVWLPPAQPATPGPRDGLALDARFRGVAEVAVLRSAWGDAQALWCALKAGRNGWNHGHLDLGSFMLDAAGVRWAEDLGSDDYNLPKYNSRREHSPRWGYLRTSNRGHNTLTLGAPARVARARQALDAAARVVRFASREGAAHAVVDLSDAYRHELPRRVARGLALRDARSRVLLQDEVGPSAGAGDGDCRTKVGPSAGAGDGDEAALVWRMFTRAAVVLSADGRSAALSREGRALSAEILSPPGARFGVSAASPSVYHGPGGVCAAGAGAGARARAASSSDEDDGDQGKDQRREARKAAKRLARRAARDTSAKEASDGSDGHLRGTGRGEMRRGVLRASVNEDENVGVSCLYISLTFGRAGETLAVLFTPLPLEVNDAATMAPPLLKSLESWDNDI
jgi:hypothetical protein